MTPKQKRSNEWLSPLNSANGVGWASLTRRSLAMGCVKPSNDEAQFWLSVRLTERFARERAATRLTEAS